MWNGIIDYDTQAWSEKVANDAKQQALSERIDQHKVRFQLQRFKEEVEEANRYFMELNKSLQMQRFKEEVEDYSMKLKE
jgi:hypothetical protein